MFSWQGLDSITEGGRLDVYQHSFLSHKFAVIIPPRENPAGRVIGASRSWAEHQSPGKSSTTCANALDALSIWILVRDRGWLK